MANNPQEEAKKAKKELQGINEIVGALDDGFQSLTSRLTDVVDELKEASGEATFFSRIQKDTLSSLKSISRANERLIKNQIDLSNGSLSSKKITEQIKNLTATREILEQRLNNLLKKQTDGLRLTKEELLEIDKLQNGIAETTQEVTDNYINQLKAAQKIENKLGVTGKLLTGISKIPVLGNLIDAEEVLASAQAEATKETATRTSVMKKSFSSLGSSLKSSLTDLKDGYINYLDLISANNELNNAMGTSVQLSSKQLKDSIDLKDKLGLEIDERESILGLSIRTGKTQEQIFDSISAQGKGVLNNRKILAEVLKTSGQLRVLYKDNPDLIGKAVIQAQRLGMTLEQTKNISKGLLNFEDSISAELEAELLTGQDLNLERARALALQGDTAGAAAELMKNLGPNGLQRFQKMNVIQQESYARALGMSVDELSDSLVKQKQLNHLNAADQQKLRERVQELRNAGKEEQAAALEKAAREGKSLQNSEKSAKLSEFQRSQSEITARNMENLKREFTSLLQGPVLSIIKFANQIMSSPILKSIAAGVGVIAGIAGTIALGKMIISTIGGVFGKGRPTGSRLSPYHVIVDGGSAGGGGGDMMDDLLGGGKGKKGGTIGKGLTRRLFSKGGRDVLKRVGGGSLLKGVGKSLLSPKRLLKGAGGVGSLLGGVALDYAEEAQMQKAQQLKEQAQVAKTAKEKEEILKRAKNAKTMGQAAGVGSAALTGAGLGATLGSAFFGIGAVPGAVIGGALGGGYQLLKNYFSDSDEAQDFILRPGQKPLKFRKDDVVMGGTKLESGRTSSTNNDALLKEFQEMKQILTAILHKEGTITLNGTKMGTAMAVGSYKIQ